jgi:hypothetical protein
VLGLLCFTGVSIVSWVVGVSLLIRCGSTLVSNEFGDIVKGATIL